MILKEFNNIDIDEDVGVARVGDDTRLIARNLRKLKFKSALDVGVGPGFIPIFLKTCGFNCDGIDINSKAIACAQKNAKKNKVKINFYVSDLFENVKDKFDLLIFNPPLGNSRSAFLTKYLELIKSFLPKENSFLLKLSFRLVKKQRIDLINRFLNEATSFFEKKGKIAILLHTSELYLIKNFSFKIVDGYQDMRLAILEF